MSIKFERNRNRLDRGKRVKMKWKKAIPAGTENRTAYKEPKRRGSRELSLRSVSGSFTVEASLVMAVIFLSLAVALRFSLELHDAVTGTAVLNEAIELEGHLPRTHTAEDEAAISSYAASRLDGMLSEKRYALQLAKQKSGCSGSIAGKNYQADMKDRGFHPELWMRRLTLLDPLKADWEKD